MSTRHRYRMPTFGRPDRSVGLVLLSGAVAAVAVFPVTWIILRALEVEPTRAVGIVFRPRSLEIVATSLALTTAVTVLSILIGVPLAFLTVRTNLPFPRLWTVLVALPLAIPSYLGAFAFIAAFGPRGELQRLLEPLGVDRLPEVFGLRGAILVITLYTYPYVYLTTRAALKTMDRSLVDAARTLNLSYRSAVRRVTLPHIRPAIAAGALLVALYAVSDFGTPAFMQVDVFTRQIFVEFRGWNLDFAALLSVQLIVITVVILALEARIRRHAPDRAGRASGGGNGSRRIDLGRWRWPAALLPAGVVALALLLPVGMFALWLVRGSGPAPAGLSFHWSFALNSVSVSVAAAVAAAGLALPVAYSAARFPSVLTRIFERTTYVGYAVPGIVIGLALVFFGANYAGVIYQTLPLLVFAYVVRFMPQSVGSTRASVLGVDRSLLEAARSLGRGPMASFRAVTLPMIAPGIVAGAALVFLTTMKELPATLLLRPTGFETLVTHIWRVEAAAAYEQAAIPAVALLLVSGATMVILLRQEGYYGQ